MAQQQDFFRIKHNNLRPDKGRILISEPFMQGIFFQRSVILLVEHTLKGAMGFVLNKQTDLLVNDFLPEIKKNPDIPIYLGGPVSTNHLFYIHTLGNDIIPDGMNVTDNLYCDGNFEALKSYMEEGGLVAGKVKFFMGYSGWSENQLREEIERDSWLVGHADIRDIMRDDGDSLWINAVNSLGNPYKTWKNYPKNPDLN